MLVILLEDKVEDAVIDDSVVEVMGISDGDCVALRTECDIVKIDNNWVFLNGEDGKHM